jgi:hypothetical protein
MFVLGDQSQIFYGGSGYAVITDFSVLEGDRVRLFGGRSYSLSLGNVAGSTALDTLISTGGDVIGVIQDNTQVVFSRDLVAA